MRRSSSEGVRREGGDGAAAKENMGSVWEVVSALATALTDARDQLMTLMHSSTMPRMTGGCAQDTTPARPHSQPNQHRSHPEYLLHPTPARVRPPGPVLRPKPTPERPRTPPPRQCTHPLHKQRYSKRVSACPPHVGARVARSSEKRKISAASNDQDRISCIGSQYAALLREETYQIREGRRAEDSSRRPPWKSR